MNLAKQTLSYTAANIFNAAVPFMMLPILTAYLLPEEYGLLSLILLLQTLLSPLVLLNFYGLVTIEYSKMSTDEFGKFISNILLLPILGFVSVEIIFFIFTGFIADLFKIPAFWILVTPAFVFFQALPLLILVIFQAEKKPIAYGFFMISLTLFNMLFSVIFVVLLKYGLPGRLWGIFLSFMLFNFVAIFILNTKGYLRLPFEMTYVKEALKFGVPLIPHVMSGTLLAMSDRIFLGNMLSIKDVGIYSVSFQVASAITIITTSINQAWAPHLFQTLNTDPSMNKKKSLVKQTYLIMLFMILITILFILLVPLIFNIFIDTKYHEGITLASFIAVGFLFKGFYFMVTNYIFYTKKTHLLSIMTMISAAVVMYLNYLLIPIYGVFGSVYAMIFSYFLFFLIVWVLSNRVYGMPWTLYTVKNSNLQRK